MGQPPMAERICEAAWHTERVSRSDARFDTPAPHASPRRVERCGSSGSRPRQQRSKTRSSTTATFASEPCVALMLQVRAA
jgi:hypothetical protein